ncbi:hypothetical protein, partial [Deinococcus marmoris]|uniref:hypothetical protein n=1 Tax=Deinococcus marmoris TaxID=249408 RepID=UPI001C37E147
DDLTHVELRQGMAGNWAELVINANEKVCDDVSRRGECGLHTHRMRSQRMIPLGTTDPHNWF